MKRVFIKVWVGFWGTVLLVHLLLFVVGTVHQALSDDPFTGEGYGFVLAFVWVVLSSPWFELMSPWWLENDILFYAALGLGVLLNSLLLAGAVALLYALSVGRRGPK